MKKLVTMSSIVLVFVLLLSMTTFAGPPAHNGTTIHIVGWGETLYSIALQYGVSIEAIMYTNDLEDADFIYVGQELEIPGPIAPPPAHPPAHPYHPMPPPSPSGCITKHTVKAGQTLSQIAQYYGISEHALMACNGLTNPDFIWVGQVLCIPMEATWRPPKPKPTPTATPAPTAVPYLRLGRNVLYEHWGRPKAGLSSCFGSFDDSTPVKRLTFETIITNATDKPIQPDWASSGNVLVTLQSGGVHRACVYTANEHGMYDPGPIQPGDTVDVTFYTHMEWPDLATKIEFQALGICFEPNSGDKIACK